MSAAGAAKLLAIVGTVLTRSCPSSATASKRQMLLGSSASGSQQQSARCRRKSAFSRHYSTGIRPSMRRCSHRLPKNGVMRWSRSRRRFRALIQHIHCRAGEAPHQSRGRVIKLDITVGGLLYHRLHDRRAFRAQIAFVLADFVTNVRLIQSLCAQIGSMPLIT